MIPKSVYAVRERGDQQHADLSDIAFLEINPEIAPLLKLSETGNIDWQRMMDNFARIPGNFTHENLKSDLDNLYNTGSALQRQALPILVTPCCKAARSMTCWVERLKKSATCMNTTGVYSSRRNMTSAAC